MPTNPRATLLTTLHGVIARGHPQAVQMVRPGGRPPTGAQCFPLPRLMLTLQGRHLLDASDPAGSRALSCRAGDALFTCPQAWTRPLWRARHRLFAIVCHEGFTRYLQFATDDAGVVRQETRIWFHTARPTAAPLAECLRCLTVCADRAAAPADAVLVELTRAAFRLAAEELAEAELEHDTAAALMRRLRAWLDDHAHEDCGRDQAAAALGVHPNHLSRLVRQQAGCRYVDLLAEVRLHRVAGLLAYSDMSVEEIASELGFGSSTWMIRRFKRRYGVTPGRYRLGCG